MTLAADILPPVMMTVMMLIVIIDVVVPQQRSSPQQHNACNDKMGCKNIQAARKYLKGDADSKSKPVDNVTGKTLFYRFLQIPQIFRSAAWKILENERPVE